MPKVNVCPHGVSTDVTVREEIADGVTTTTWSTPICQACHGIEGTVAEIVTVDHVVMVDRVRMEPVPLAALHQHLGVKVEHRGTAYRPDGPSSYDLILGKP